MYFSVYRSSTYYGIYSTFQIIQWSLKKTSLRNCFHSLLHIWTLSPSHISSTFLEHLSYTIQPRSYIAAITLSILCSFRNRCPSAHTSPGQVFFNSSRLTCSGHCYNPNRPTVNSNLLLAK